ncbi:putative microtubule-associated protein TORTIFOLIA1 [Sesbania bispinosa]|nr:putative microtubule-associated protein TORTIFOLIA1 [Sesbania bispinosa]
MPRLGKLMKNDSCKAKASVPVRMGSVFVVGGGESCGAMNWAVGNRLLLVALNPADILQNITTFNTCDL